jgi:asparagine synthase (glutamine-hydrolysing)
MCGFLVEFSFDTYPRTSQEQFAVLLALSKHRGPDNSHIEATQDYQLGFNRLAILDLSSLGDQPMYSPSERYHVVFNGEIYNYKDLALAFELKDLTSTSDTEVLVHLFDKIGVEETLKQLNGMFAICIMDRENTTCHLARDMAGIKPLFYGVSHQGVVAASQFDQLFMHTWFATDLALRPEIVKEYFGFGYMQAPNTIYENIYQVNLGELVKITKSGVVEKTDLLTIDATISKRSTLETSKEVHHLLDTSVKMQLTSDVPLATFLSGGVDSPLITAIAKQHESTIKGFTVKVDDKDLDESEMARLYAQHLHLDHDIEPIDTARLLSAINAHFEKLPEPFGDYSSIPTYLIAKLAKEQYTVMLSGDGGDELFFGYPRMLDVIKKRHWFKIPFFIRRPIVILVIKLNLFASWAPYHYKTFSAWYFAKHCHISKSALDSFIPKIEVSEEFKTIYKFSGRNTKTELLKWMRLNEYYGHLQRVLVKVDRMSMAHSLEVRVPFLDKHVVEQAFCFAPDQFSSDSDLKQVLKRIMTHYFPNTLMHDKKKGFTVPMEHWLRHELKADVKKVILEAPIYGNDIIASNELKSYVMDFFNGKHNSAWGVWHIYAWQKWAIKYQFI